MASHAVEIEDIVKCVFSLVPSWTYRLPNPQRWDRPDCFQKVACSSRELDICNSRRTQAYQLLNSTNLKGLSRVRSNSPGKNHNRRPKGVIDTISDRHLPPRWRHDARGCARSLCGCIKESLEIVNWPEARAHRTPNSVHRHCRNVDAKQTFHRQKWSTANVANRRSGWIQSTRQKRSLAGGPRSGAFGSHPVRKCQTHETGNVRVGTALFLYQQR